MANKVGVIFIENYTAGGSDQVARSLIHCLPLKCLTVLVNRRNDTSILLAGKLPPHVQVEYYELLTVAELSHWANAVETPLLRVIARCASFALRYLFAIYSIMYFWIRLMRIKADVFLANNGGYPGAFYCRTATLAASLIPNLQVFHLVHSMAVSTKGLSWPFEWCIDRLISNRSRLLTISRATAMRLCQVRAIHQSATIIYNGIPDVPLAPREESTTFRILHVGYFEEGKNQLMLIEALAELQRLSEIRINVRFVGADSGDGYMTKCRKAAEDLGVADHIEFAGFVNRMEPCYAQADVLVMCSHVEGMPIAILEAMRAGRPVVSTEVGGIAEQIENGVCGYLVPPNDSAALVKRLELLIQDPTLRASFGQAARARYESIFTISEMIDKYINVLGLR